MKYGFNNLGQEIIEDMIVIENKLKQSINLTDNQEDAKKENSYTVRSSVKESVFWNRYVFVKSELIQ